MRDIVHLSRVFYTGCLLLYPRELRRRFGPEMADVFEDMTREAIAHRGMVGLVSSCWSALSELLGVALPSQFCNATMMAGILSFTTAAILFLVFFRAVS